jgi:hypothetical protein
VDVLLAAKDEGGVPLPLLVDHYLQGNEEGSRSMRRPSVRVVERRW